MPHKNWRRGFLSSSSHPLAHDPDSPSSPRSPLTPTRPRPTHLSSYSPHRSNLSRHLYPNIDSPTPPEFDKGESRPAEPESWVWFCHLCNRRYALGVTRRCLEDGHFFCSVPPPLPPSPKIQFDSDSDAKSNINPQEALLGKLQRDREIRQKQLKRRKVQRGCRSEFDYYGWEVYNAWRKYKIQRKKLGGRGRRGCLWECNFPSQCLNERQAHEQHEQEAQEVEARVERERQKLEDAERGRRRARTPRNEDENSILGFQQQQRIQSPSALEKWASEWEVHNGTNEDEERLIREAHRLADEAKIHTTVIEYSPEPTTTESNKKGDRRKSCLEVEENAKGVENKEGPIGLDADGLGEEEVQSEYLSAIDKQMKKRRSVEVADGEGGVSPPSSPLKVEFSLDDKSWERMEGVLYSDNDDNVVSPIREEEERRDNAKTMNCKYCRENGMGSGRCWFCGSDRQRAFEEEIVREERGAGRSLMLRAFWEKGEGFGDEEFGEF